MWISRNVSHRQLCGIRLGLIPRRIELIRIESAEKCETKNKTKKTKTKTYQRGVRRERDPEPQPPTPHGPGYRGTLENSSRGNGQARPTRDSANRLRRRSEMCMARNPAARNASTLIKLWVNCWGIKNDDDAPMFRTRSCTAVCDDLPCVKRHRRRRRPGNSQCRGGQGVFTDFFFFFCFLDSGLEYHGTGGKIRFR